MMFMYAMIILFFAFNFTVAILPMNMKLYDCYERCFGKQKKLINITLLRMDQINTLHKNFSLTAQRKARLYISHNTSENILFIYDVATQLPPEVGQHIIFLMCDHDKDKAKQFYNTPIGESFLGKRFLSLIFDGDQKAIKVLNQLPLNKAYERYHEIKKCYKSNNAIGPLYATPQEERDLILGILNSECYVPLILTGEDKKKINCMNQKLKQYVKGKKTLVYLASNQDDDDLECVIGFICALPIAASMFATAISITFCGMGLLALICGGVDKDNIIKDSCLMCGGGIAAMTALGGIAACMIYILQWCSSRKEIL